MINGTRVFIIPCGNRRGNDEIDTAINKLIKRHEWPMMGTVTGSYQEDISYHGSPCITEFTSAQSDTGCRYTTEYGHVYEASILTLEQFLNHVKNKLTSNKKKIGELTKENIKLKEVLQSNGINC